MDDQRQFDFLDIVSLISFAVGLANYQENVNQTDVQKIVNQAIANIHEHLKNQDEKIDLILKELNINEIH